MASEKYEILETWTSKVIVVTTVQCRLACLVAVTFPIGAIFSPVFSNTWLVLSKATQSRILTTSFALGHQCYQQSEVEKHPWASGAARWHDNEQPEYVAPLIWGTHACNWLLHLAAPLSCTEPVLDDIPQRFWFSLFLPHGTYDELNSLQCLMSTRMSSKIAVMLED